MLSLLEVDPNHSPKIFIYLNYSLYMNLLPKLLNKTTLYAEFQFNFKRISAYISSKYLSPKHKFVFASFSSYSVASAITKFLLDFHYARDRKIRKMFEQFFSKFVQFPKVRAEEAEEEDLVDPQQTLRDKCSEGHHAKSLAEKYQACNDRVNSRSQTAETCVEELFDLLHAIDHCVTEKLWSHLK